MKDFEPGSSGVPDSTAVVTATPWARGGWQVTTNLEYGEPANDGSLGMAMSVWRADDPGDRTAVLPLRLGESPSVLVVAPDGATTVRAMDHGAVVDTAAVQGSAAVVDAPHDPDLVFEATDRDGRVLSTGKLSQPLPPDPDVVRW
ncbi:hypothetical protein [Asanoa sp. NPDC050611]|uniref:hypothetical protein n=1 Tax=Asanoa sp. NPDC050611 TaxID=3157098 RepID=UPI0033D460EB